MITKAPFDRNHLWFECYLFSNLLQIIIFKLVKQAIIKLSHGMVYNQYRILLVVCSFDRIWLYDMTSTCNLTGWFKWHVKHGTVRQSVFKKCSIYLFKLYFFFTAKLNMCFRVFLFLLKICLPYVCCRSLFWSKKINLAQWEKIGNPFLARETIIYPKLFFRARVIQYHRYGFRQYA